MSTLTLLGTGACEGIPAPFCNCTLCDYARKHPGPDRRRRFSVLIDNETLVDFGPDTVNALRDFNIDERSIRRILVTHSHVDHFAPLDLLWMNFYDELPTLTLYSGVEVQEQLRQCHRAVMPQMPIKAPQVMLNTLGKTHHHNGWEITPLRAAHCLPDECAFLYLIQTPEKKRIIIFSDTGNPPEETWTALRGAQADAIIIEMSFGIHEPWCHEESQHLGAQAALKMLRRLQEIEGLKPNAKCLAAHFSHCSKTTHQELQEHLQPTPITPGYDGMTIQV